MAKNHLFVDGNKRIAFDCGVVFFELNGVRIEASEIESAIMFESLAAGKLGEYELTSWFKPNSEVIEFAANSVPERPTKANLSTLKRIVKRSDFHDFWGGYHPVICERWLKKRKYRIENSV